VSKPTSWIDDIVARFGFSRPSRTPWAPPDAEDLARLARLAGGPLPETYDYFLRRYGAVALRDDDAQVEAPIVEPCPWGDGVAPGVFYPVMRGHQYSIEDEIETYRGRIPRGVVPIAGDAGGNQICLDVAGEFAGTVWFWDHEQRWFTRSIPDADRELREHGIDRGGSVHDIIRDWARLHAAEFDRPPDYVGMYRIAASFDDFLRSLRAVPYQEYRDAAPVVTRAVLAEGAESPASAKPSPRPDLSPAQRAALEVDDADALGLALNSGTDEQSHLATIMATIQGRVRCLTWLLRRPETALVTTGDGQTLLHLAARFGHVGIIETMLAMGADINARTNSGMTPLMMASGGSRTEAVRLLVHRGADQSRTNRYGVTAHAIAQGPNRDAVKRILEGGGE